MTRLFMAVFASCAMLCGLASTIALADGCDDVRGKGWCLEVVDEFAIWIQDIPLKLEALQRASTTPGAPNMSVVINEFLENAGPIFTMKIRPIPSMRSLNFGWDLGLRLKNGEIVWATKWVYLDRNGYVARSPGTSHLLIPGVHETTKNAQSFVILIAFPGKDQTGRSWGNGDAQQIVLRDIHSLAVIN